MALWFVNPSQCQRHTDTGIVGGPRLGTGDGDGESKGTTGLEELAAWQRSTTGLGGLTLALRLALLGSMRMAASRLKPSWQSAMRTATLCGTWTRGAFGSSDARHGTLGTGTSAMAEVVAGGDQTLIGTAAMIVAAMAEAAVEAVAAAEAVAGATVAAIAARTRQVAPAFLAAEVVVVVVVVMGVDSSAARAGSGR